MNNLMDAVSLSSLLASRLCHDLINPVGALSAGLEIMEEETDPEMRAEAVKLIRNSTEKSVALLSFARMAYGAGGGLGAEIDLADAKHCSEQLYKHVKADLEWRLAPGMAPKNYVKAVMNMTMLAADSVPRAGSKVIVQGDLNRVLIIAEGARAKIKPELKTALGADASSLEAKQTPAFITSLIVGETGGKIICEEVNETRVEFTLSFAS